MTHAELIKMFGSLFNMVTVVTCVYFVLKTRQLTQDLAERRRLREASFEDRLFELTDDERLLVLRRFTSRELRDELERRD